MADEPPRRAAGAFMRDVMINVVANLVAAVIIYLLGVLVGLFPYYRKALLISVIILLGFVVPASWFAMIVSDRHVVKRIAAGAIIFMHLGLLAAFWFGGFTSIWFNIFVWTPYCLSSCALVPRIAATTMKESKSTST
jgi:hypothetical protein